MLVSDGSWVSEACKAISKIAKDQEDLERRLAILVADKMLQYYKPLVKPEAPLSVQKYRLLNRDQRHKFNKDNPDWRESPELGEFFTKESGVECQNQSNVWWLTKCRGLDIGDERKNKIQAALDEFSVDQRRFVTQRPDRAYHDPEVESVREMFHGTAGTIGYETI